MLKLYTILTLHLFYLNMSILVPIKIRYMCADGAVIAAPLRDELPCFPVFVLLGSQVIYAVIPDFIRRRRFEVLFTAGHIEPGR